MLLLAVLVVAEPVQLSPPARNTDPLSGSRICEPQKMSVFVPLGSVRWPPPSPTGESHTS